MHEKKYPDQDAAEAAPADESDPATREPDQPARPSTLDIEPSNDNAAPRPPEPHDTPRGGVLPRREVFSQHRALLQARALKESTWVSAGIYSTRDPVEIANLKNWTDDKALDRAKQLGDCLVIPYPGVQDFARLRPDNPRLQGDAPEDVGDRAGHDHAYVPTEDARKSAKYESPAESQLHAYVIDSLRAQVESAKRLYIAESEFKALVINQEGGLAVGLAGVNTAHDKQFLLDEGEDLPLSGLREQLVAGREVCVLFDMPDMTKNVAVIRAAVRVARMVDACDATALVGYLDEVPGEPKTGVDDWAAHELRAGRRSKLCACDFALARPARPNELLEWLKAHADENGLTAKHADMKTLLLQAATWVRVWHEHESKGWRAWAKAAAKKFKLETSVLDDLVKHLGVGQRQLVVSAWWATWVKDNRVIFDPKTEMFSMSGTPMESSILVGHAYQVADAMKLRRNRVDTAFQLWAWEERHSVLVKLREQLPFKPGVGREQLHDFVRALTGGTNATDVAAVAHFIWQVKRKLHGLSVDNHLMLVLTGAQGGGKTTAVRYFLGPVALRVDGAADLKLLEDERQLARLADNVVVFFDEMSKATATDVDALKNRITADSVKWRTLGTNHYNTRNMLATFIGASNNTLQDMIHDPTGMRRFYELKCQKPCDWDVLNAIDYAMLWVGVDHTGPSPIVPHLEEVRKRQEACRSKDSAEEFVEVCCVDVAQDERCWTSGSVLYEYYASWMKKQQRPPFSQPKFGRRLKALLGEGGFKHSNGVKYALVVVTFADALLEQVRDVG